MTTTTVSRASQHGILLKLLRRLRAYIALRNQQRIDRAAFRKLLRMDDNMLRDIGVSRDDVIWAAYQPLSVNAAEELRKISLANRGVL